ncbi:TerB family tellurite resistance protein [Tindallia californiensis]|uniref:Co-chaperone DjlA N-terminal domain-containing protein n=1 Tax=Tindallia californiensis TaxID=159292 RepID=A0A1H3JXF6_9FIRM|nr:TerB family tellurite resistance protein [Tindallia californiensis]SDY44008.1 hypothetical protein SAMN05192546_102129 [Tindallia californiensis]
MVKETKVREPRKMPVENRLAYGKLLGLMILSQNKPEAMTMKEFYRALKSIALKDRDRQVIFEYMMDPDESATSLTQQMMKHLNDQEENLIRFSLLEDLYRVMKADYYEDEGEKNFFNEVIHHLEIKERHIEQVRQTYERDNLYLPENVKPSISRMAMNQIASISAGLATAGIVFYVTNTKRKKQSPIEKAATVSTALVVYKTVESLANYKANHQLRMQKKLKKENSILLIELEKDIAKDIRMIKQIIRKKSSQFSETFTWQDVLVLLEKTKAYLEKS